MKKNKNMINADDEIELTIWQRLKDQYQLFLLLLPALLITFIFKYIPMYGILIAFKQYNPLKGILGSQWIGFEHFRNFLTSPNFNVLLVNTLKLSIYGLLWGFFPPIILALMINQLMSDRIKQYAQTILYTPNFISTVIIVGMVFLFFSANGPIVRILTSMGITPPQFLTDPESFRSLYIASGIWQGMGWASILYTSALISIPPDLYEAAELDGANLFQKIINIELPALKPIMIVNFVLAVGGIMGIGYEKAYLMQTSLNLPTSEIISTYVYKIGLQQGNYSYSTAVGLFNSVINFILLAVTYLFVNKIEKKKG
ncbi:ABC transporter permease [Anaerococcus sp. Marseille-P3915]|uniref:ABC transporter permease n=1 Tax=Anaerococcus sp. Marseille-P3915 TaxID=2057799 RepID=UPI0018F870D7|nr:ABC transporter permease subunit [Anaerococcus sp. Marseille-P3915]